MDRKSFHVPWLFMLLVICILISIPALSLTLAQEPTDPTVSAIAGQIFFTSDRTGNYDIFRMHTGSDPTNLTSHPRDDWYPNGSWDGKKVTFAVKPLLGEDDIYIMDADGNNRMELTSGMAAEVHPAWSPDGTQIAFSSRLTENENTEIHIMNADGTERLNLTNNSIPDAQPAWSPDGSQIVFSSNVNGNIDLYVMDADGSDRRRLTTHAARDDHPAWSPDGTRIAFASSRNGNRDIYIINTDGSEEVQLTTNVETDTQPTWSPDGTQIAFSSTRDGNYEIYMMQADGSNQVNITNHPAEDTYPSWVSAGEEPDTTQLVLETPIESTIAPLAQQVFALDAPAGLSLLVELTPLDDATPLWLYSRTGSPPTLAIYDQRTIAPTPRGTYDIALAPTHADTYYFSVFNRSMTGTPTPFRIVVHAVTHRLTDVQPRSAGNAGTVTLELSGLGFDEGMQATLQQSGSSAVSALSVHIVNATRAYATFDLTGLSPGLYDIAIITGDTETTLEDALSIVAGEPGRLDISVSLPEQVRQGRTFLAYIDYVNAGDADIPAPLIFIETPTNSPFTLDLNNQPAGIRAQVLAINEEGLAGVLPPGAGGTIPIQVLANDSTIRITTRYVDGNNTSSMQWQTLRDDWRVYAGDNPQFDAMFDQLIDQTGATWGDYATMLADNATLLPATQGDNREQRDLMALEMREAEAAIGTSLSGRIDSPGFYLDVSDIRVSATNMTTQEAFTTRTLNDGSFIFESVTPGTYEFAVEGSALIMTPAPGDITVSDGQAISDVVITTTPGAHLTGQVSGPDGNILSAARLSLYQGDEVVGGAMVDTEEVYHLQGFEPGTYTLVVQAEGYAPTRIENVPVGEGITTRDITMGSEATITGRVLSAGSPVSDTFVLATRTDQDAWATSATQSSADGTFTLGSLASGTYTVTLIHDQTVMDIPDVVLTAGGNFDVGDASIERVQGVQAATPRISEVSLNTSTNIIDNFFLLWVELSLRSSFIPAALDYLGPSTQYLWHTYLGGSTANPPEHRYFTDGDEIVEGWINSPGFRDSSSVGLGFYLREIKPRREVIINDIRSMFENGDLTCQNLPEQGIQIPLHSLPTVRERNLLELQTNYNEALEIPGNIAGGIGKGNGKGGAAGQVHDDRRQLTGSVVVQRHGPDTVNLHFDVRMHIDDTIDFIPGNLAGIERLITAQLMLLEAYDWAYDVPFTVSYQDREHFPDYVLSLDNQNGTCDDPDPLDPPTSEAGGSGSTTTVNSWDPNEKVSIGIGAEGYVPDGQALLYTIYFENLSSATAPAQEVFITDQLDDRLDWSTLEVLAFGFNNTQVDMQDHPHLSAITTTVSTDPNPVRVQTDLDPETGMFQWTARSEDAVTGELPEDPLAGFLPPNDDQHSGEGFVTFRIEPLDSWVDAEPMTNEARIVFDTNEPIDTNTVTNTLDTMSPTSRVQSLPAETQGNTVSVHWSGSDAGSGIATYDVFVSEDGGPFTQWLTDTVTTSAVFTGSLEHTYSFYSGAVDRVGNRQSVVPEAQATTKLIQQQQMIYLPLVRR